MPTLDRPLSHMPPENVLNRLAAESDRGGELSGGTALRTANYQSRATGV
jgi:hypothetical protein